MNEVEQHLRDTGKWDSSIPGHDRDGHAVQGTWWARYYAEWLDAHQDRPSSLDPARWCRDGQGNLWWVTQTPDWDAQWFRGRNVEPPKLIGDPRRTYWHDYGDGLRGLCYDPEGLVVLL